MIYLHREPYIAKNNQEYLVVMQQSSSAKQWIVYLMDANYTKKAVATTTYKPTIDQLNGVLYVFSKDTVKYAYYDQDNTFVSGTVSNAPWGQFGKAIKNRLFLGGETISTYEVGTATFTQTSPTVTSTVYEAGTATFTYNSASVSGGSTSWASNASAGDLIGVGASPSKYYEISSVDSDTAITLTEPYQEVSASSSTYEIVKTKWKSNVRAGDKIGVGASPTKYYTVSKVNSNKSLTLTENFAEATASNSAYEVLREESNVQYYAAEQIFNNWTEPGVFGGDDAGYTSTIGKCKGIGKYDDAAIFFTQEEGLFIDGINVADWSVPRGMRLPTGTISNDSIVTKHGFLSYYALDGVYLTKGGSLRLDSLEAEPYSNIIYNTYIEDVDTDEKLQQYIFSYIYKDLLLVSVPCESLYSITETGFYYETGTVECTDSSTGNSSYNTGTATFTQNSTAVAGSGTAWLTNAEPGDLIGVGASPTKWYKISDVTSDTAITLFEPFAEATASGSAYVIKQTKTVTGSSTDWLSNIYAGDQISFDGGSTYYDIDSVNSDTSLVLEDCVVDDVSASSDYIVRKRRNNRVYVLDTRTNVNKKGKFAWTVFDNINATSFCFYKGKLLYGSSIDNYIYEYDTGGTLYGQAITATATTKRSGGRVGSNVKKKYGGLLIKGRGVGTLYITPIIDGVEGTELSYTFSDTTNTEEVYFPRDDQYFNYIGYEHQFRLEFRGSNEDVYIYPPKVGYLPITKSASTRGV